MKNKPNMGDLFDANPMSMHYALTHLIMNHLAVHNMDLDAVEVEEVINEVLDTTSVRLLTTCIVDAISEVHGRRPHRETKLQAMNRLNAQYEISPEPITNREEALLLCQRMHEIRKWNHPRLQIDFEDLGLANAIVNHWHNLK